MEDSPPFASDPRVLVLECSCSHAHYAGSNRLLMQTLGHVALVVRNYDEALSFFVHTLGFRLIEDTDMGDGKRWVLVAPPGSCGTSLLLAQASTPEQQSRIGDQTGGRVFLFLHTDDFWRDYHAMQARDVKFCRPPREEPYGTVAVFYDLYGNMWDLLQLKESAAARYHVGGSR